MEFVRVSLRSKEALSIKKLQTAVIPLGIDDRAKDCFDINGNES